MDMFYPVLFTQFFNDFLIVSRGLNQGIVTWTCFILFTQFFNDFLIVRMIPRGTFCLVTETKNHSTEYNYDIMYNVSIKSTNKNTCFKFIKTFPFNYRYHIIIHDVITVKQDLIKNYSITAGFFSIHTSTGCRVYYY